MNEILCSAGRGVMPREDCLKCALSQNNECGFDYAVLRWLINDEEQNKRSTEVHVTDITGCLRRAWYDKVEPSPEFPHAALARQIGSVIHKGLEGDDDALQSELPISRGAIQGTADIVYRDGRVLDFKTTRWLVPDKLPYSSHPMQVNIYAWMLRGMGREVNKLQIQYVDVTGPTKCRKCRVPVEMVMGEVMCPQCGNAPKGAHMGALLVDIPLMNDEQIETIICDRIDTLSKSIETKVAPEQEPSFLCNYCASFAKCQPNIRSN